MYPQRGWNYLSEQVRGADPRAGAAGRSDAFQWGAGGGHGKHQHLLAAGVAGARPLFRLEAGQPVLHQAAPWPQERHKGCGVDSHVPAQGVDTGELCPRGAGSDAAAIQPAQLRPHWRHHAQAGKAGQRPAAMQHPHQQLRLQHGQQELHERGGAAIPGGVRPRAADGSHTRPHRQQVGSRGDQGIAHRRGRPRRLRHHPPAQRGNRAGAAAQGRMPVEDGGALPQVLSRAAGQPADCPRREAPFRHGHHRRSGH